MALGPAILLDVALNPRVQEVAGRLVNSVYSRIFKNGANKPGPTLIDLQTLPPEQHALAERLNAIEQQIANLPTDDEMAAAFASLQAEIRLGQRRITRIATAFGMITTALLLALLLR